MFTHFIKKYPLASIIGFSLLLLIPHLGTIQTNIMEARNLITAREMLHNHDWIFTTMDGLPRYEKPPLPTWLTAMSGMLFGFGNMFFLRLPAALVTVMLVYFFYRLLKKMLPDPQQAFYSSLVLITSFYIFFSGRDNQWDIYTHSFMMGGIFFLFLAFEQSKWNWTYILLSALFTGGSFLSKGPVSIYALFLPFIIAYLVVYRANSKRNILILVATLLIGLPIGLSWPVYVRLTHPLEVANAVGQEASRWGMYNTRPFYYYWSFVTQSGIWTVPAFIALLYPYMKRRVSNLKAYRFSLLWTLLSVVLLSVIPEKKSRYLLPVLIPLAMNTGFYIDYLRLSFSHMQPKKERVSVYFSFGSIGIIALAIPVVLFILMKGFAAGYIFWQVATSLVALACGVTILYGLASKKFSAVFFGIIFLMCGLVVFFIPVSKFYYSNDNYFPASSLKTIEDRYAIHTYEANGFRPEIIWDYGSSIPEIIKKDKLTPPAEDRFGLLIIPGQEAFLKDSMKIYSFTKLATVDVNNIPAKAKGYNPGLVKDYYLVQKQAPK